MPTTQPTPGKRTRPKAATVLEALELGQSVIVDGHKLVMHEGQVLIEAQAYRYRGNERTELPPRHLGYDMPLNHFIQACEQISDDEIFLIAAQNVMARDARRRAR